MMRRSRLAMASCLAGALGVQPEAFVPGAGATERQRKQLELHEAAQGRYESLMALAKLLTRTIGGQIMHGMQLSVMCTEDAGEMVVDEADRGSLIGVNLITTMQAQCEAWPKGERPAGFREPLSGPVPVLVLSGEFDPVTPPRYGDQIAWRHVMIGLTEDRTQYEDRGYTPLRMSRSQRLFRDYGMPFGRPGAL